MQSATERYLKEKNYPMNIVRWREFHPSQEILNAKAIFLPQQGKRERSNKAQPITPEKESALWEKGQLTNVNFKNLTEQLGFRVCQEHYDAYVEDIFKTARRWNWSCLVPGKSTKTQSGGLTIRRRRTPQAMFSTDGGKGDPVRLFKLWLSKRPEGMKNTRPLYLSIIHRPKSADVWYTKVRMEQNTIGNIIKSMASCLNKIWRTTAWGKQWYQNWRSLVNRAISSVK